MSKKRFYQKILMVFFLSLLIVACKTNSKVVIKEKGILKKPNIIFIIADDLGIMDIQSYANHFTKTDTTKMFYETPYINKLMAEGTSFSQAYANQLCSPTRAGILTGKYAGRLGFTTAMPSRPTYYNQNLPVPKGNYIHDVLGHKDDIRIEQALKNGISNSALPAGTAVDQGRDEVTIPESLKDYTSAFIGKWHVGGFGAEGYQPGNQGFIPLAWFDSGGSTYFDWRKDWNNKSKKDFPKMPQEEWAIGGAGEESDEKYLTDDLTQKALTFIEKSSKEKDKPFLLYFAHFAVHSPNQGKEGEIAHFEGKATQGWNNHKDPVYASMLKSMDRSVGQILDKLKEMGIENNTLVVFMSDNGGIDCKITPNKDGTDNSPFLGGKACLTEGGIRVPLIFRWTGRIEAGKWVDVPVDYTDLYPTLMEAAGYDTKAIINKLSLDGQSIIPLLSDRANRHKSYTKKTHYWHYPFNVIYNSPFESLPLTPNSAIRDGDYKLIFDWYGRFYLFNIEKDPYEKNNLSSKMPDLANTMHKKLMVWLKANVEKRYWPTVNENYNPKKEVRKTPFVDLFSN
jgi:arylsulfatase A-like enzyme